VLRIILAAMQELEQAKLLIPQALNTAASLNPGGKVTSKGSQPYRLHDLVELIR